MHILRSKPNEEYITQIALTRGEMASAIRQFICSCHPEFAVGYRIEVPAYEPTDQAAHVCEVFVTR